MPGTGLHPAHHGHLQRPTRRRPASPSGTPAPSRRRPPAGVPCRADPDRPSFSRVRPPPSRASSAGPDADPMAGTAPPPAPPARPRPRGAPPSSSAAPAPRPGRQRQWPDRHRQDPDRSAGTPAARSRSAPPPRRVRAPAPAEPRDQHRRSTPPGRSPRHPQRRFPPAAAATARSADQSVQRRGQGPGPATPSRLDQQQIRPRLPRSTVARCAVRASRRPTYQGPRPTCSASSIARNSSRYHHAHRVPWPGPCDISPPRHRPVRRGQGLRHAPRRRAEWARSTPAATIIVGVPALDAHCAIAVPRPPRGAHASSTHAVTACRAMHTSRGDQAAAAASHGRAAPLPGASARCGQAGVSDPSPRPRPPSGMPVMLRTRTCHGCDQRRSSRVADAAAARGRCSQRGVGQAGVGVGHATDPRGARATDLARRRRPGPETSIGSAAVAGA